MSDQSAIAVIQTDLKYIREKVDAVHEQAKKTNGRVTKLEQWRAWILGFCACTTTLLIPVAFYLLYRGIDFLLHA